jgi:hypothetical protein
MILRRGMDWNRLGLFNKIIPLTPLKRGNQIQELLENELRNKIFEVKVLVWGSGRATPPS